MDFTFTDDQLAFKEAISRFLMTEAAPEVLREIWETDSGRSPQLMTNIAEQGMLAVSVPEQVGGIGMGDVAWSLLTQELGYYCIADVVADTGYTAVGLLSSLPQSSQRDEWLEQIAAGALRVAVSHPVNSLVSDAHLADLILMFDGDDLHAVVRDQVDLEESKSIDTSRRLAKVSWSSVPDTKLIGGEVGRALKQQLLNRGSLATAGQLLGLAQRMLDLSVDYVAQRKQFGRAIGSFQALKHHLADIAKEIEFARPVLYRAAHSLESGHPDVDFHVSQAKLFATKAAHLAAKHGIQVHGAMGYTWEVDLQMFMKRTWALESYWGSKAFHQQRLNQFVHGTLVQALDGAGPSSTFGRG
ncbi:acyl-CoA dehydrogenase (plasmid) [Vibrio alfacsensis]|uniref:Acyl-CoA dehydrogenase n=1 Tax=Vibrio alfacsensis TaxID=1074311 RepID=A0ABN5PKI8_9VIBR|nr:acyl-CoA dehydrogenase family protein [Vibrio alfacsensis]AXY03692.1 acyl-CoA dehydrogenase [Vibrio alfacsensis]